MQKKVLIAKDLNGQTVGLVCFECEQKLVGKLKLFDEVFGTLVLKIQNSILKFDNANSNFEFETVFHNLDSIGLILCKDNKILVTAKTENFNQSFEDLLDEIRFLKQSEEQNENDKIFQDAKIDEQKVKKNEKKDEKNEDLNKKLAKNEKSLSENLEKSMNFFEQIKSQFDELFNSNKHFTELENKIEGTKWVKVFCKSEFSNHYILGKIFDGENLTHICCGFPAKSENDILSETLKPYAQWLPIEVDGVSGSGYFITYQDAQTGENVLI